MILSVHLLKKLMIQTMTLSVLIISSDKDLLQLISKEVEVSY